MNDENKRMVRGFDYVVPDFQPCDHLVLKRTLSPGCDVRITASKPMTWEEWGYLSRYLETLADRMERGEPFSEAAKAVELQSIVEHRRDDVSKN
jgi:hypothetical protein